MSVRDPDQRYYTVAIMAALLARATPVGVRADVVPIRTAKQLAEEAWELFDAVEEGWVNRLPL